RLLQRVAAAVEQPSLSPLTEDYTVFRVQQLLDGDGAPFPPAQLSDEDVSRLLLGEPRPVAASAIKDLLSPRLSYFPGDLAERTWGEALVVEPVRDDTDVQYVLEFAHA